MDKINIVENKHLLELAKIFSERNYHLYLVGGSVRDFLLGLCPIKNDFDICSNVSIEELKNMLENSDFQIKDKNLALGVVNIKIGADCFEYARFRREFYENSKSHNPNKVEFVDDIAVDVKRRDFTINSIYYDITERTIIDIYNGVDDLLNRKIKAVLNPDKTLSVDPARILRMMQFALRLDFAIDDNTMKEAIRNSINIKKLSKIRLEKELLKIDSARKCYLNYAPKDFDIQKEKYFKLLNI